MSEDRTNPPAGAEAEFLIRTRDNVASGGSVYGPVGSPEQIKKLATLDAQISFGRRIGEVPLAEEPMSADVIAQQRLAAEWPLGEPSATIPEHLVEADRARVAELTALDGRQLAVMADQVAADFADRPSRVSGGHGRFDRETGKRPSGHQIVESLLADASQVIEAMSKDPTARAALVKALRADRNMLERYAARGQEIARYKARRSKYGLK